jgi:hypothetical protein
MAQNQPDKQPEYEPYQEEQRAEQPGPSAIKISRVINYAFRILESLILIRVLLKALGGNPINGFVMFIYTITEPFVMPFLTVFNVPNISTSIGVLELGSLIAIAFYILLNYAIVKLILILSSRT